MRNLARRLEESKITNFQKKVLLATMTIPKGETRTYKEVAKMINNPRAYRAVGTALRLNPFPIVIPCHRVIRSNGDLGNYSGIGGRKRKLELLRKEEAV